jgi:hypothetical protein
MRVALLLLTGCFTNPTVEVDQQELVLPRGTSRDVVVKVDGAVELDYVTWLIDDPRIASVTPEWDASRLRIGGSLEGETIVHLGTHGEIIDIPVHVAPPTIVQIWIEPSAVTTTVGELVHVKAGALDSVLSIRDITRDAHWEIRDPTIANLDMAGMMVEAVSEGSTALHIVYGDHTTLAPVTIFK